MNAPKPRSGSKSQWRSLPVEHWPPKHRAAREAATRRDSPVRRGGHAASLAPATRDILRNIYGHFLGWLQEAGDLDPHGDPASEMTIEPLARFVTERRETVADSTTYNDLRKPTMMMNCLVPGHDWKWIWRQSGGPSLVEARAARKPPREFPAGVLLHRLVDAMREAMDVPDGQFSRERVRDCLLVALAVITGLRRRNLTAMRLGHNLIQRKFGWEIMFDGAEVKTDAPFLSRVPPLFDPFIERYVTIDRPRLFTNGEVETDALRISHRGNHGISAQQIAVIFGKIGMEFLGYPINPHSVRHTMASRILVNDPRDLETASLALTHKNTRAVCEFYDQSGPRAAQMVWSAVVAGIRSGGGKATHRKIRARQVIEVRTRCV